MGSFDLPPKPARRSFGLSRIQQLLALSAVSALLLAYPTYQFYAAPDSEFLQLSTAQQERFEAHLQRCAEFEKEAYWERKPETNRNRVNPRYKGKDSDTITVLQNATVWDGEEWIGSTAIAIRQGTIIELTEGLSAGMFKDKRVEVIDLAGKIVTPGIVDMHSHSGVDNLPYLAGSGETNEATALFTPFVRTLDGIHTDDLAHTMIASGGVTTSLILPGSANIIGGEAFAIKNAIPSDNLVESMLVEPARGENRTRWVKMACGENPKRVYPEQAVTRMGEAWKFRQHLAQAKDVIASQEAWCVRAKSNNPRTRYHAAVEGLSYADAIEWDMTTSILRGQIRVNTHCYEPHDLETMLRHTHEFGFRISAFHHTISSWKVTELLTSQGYPITQATFAELGYFKKEAYDSNLYAGKILVDAGIPLAYKSDHPVTNAKHLIQQAQVGYQYGVPEDAALKSVTSVPATAIGLDDRIGYIREGYDADLVIWDSHPLSTGATPLQVYIDGTALYDSAKVAETLPHAKVDIVPQPPQIPDLGQEQVSQLQDKFKKSRGKLLVVHGITNSLISKYTASSIPLTLVTNGTSILCLAPSCSFPAEEAEIITLSHGTITPAVYAVANRLGLSEIELEDATQDGNAPLSPASVAYAHYGLHFGSKLLARAFESGVTRAITAPLHGGGLLRGVSAGFFTAGETPLDGIWENEVALHVVIGQSSKRGEATISLEIAHLETLINLDPRLSNGTLPVVVHANNKDDIAQIILLKQRISGVRFIIFGGGEAWAVAEGLAGSNIPVILAYWRCMPADFENRRCLTGPPLTISPVNILNDAGVLLGIGIFPDDDLVRDLPADAAWVGKYLGWGPGKSWDLVSRNIEIMFQIEPTEDVLVWEGNPSSGGKFIGVVA